MDTSTWSTLAMGGPVQYRIRVQGELREQWSAWFVGMAIEAESDETSVLCGLLELVRVDHLFHSS